MAMPSSKELKKIAKACREAGIKVYKGEGFELTFTDEAPEPKRPRKAASGPTSVVSSPANEKFTTDSLSEEELLMWSAGPGGMALNFEEEKA
jgi:hypothetical protein